MNRRKIAGTPALHQRIRELQDEAEWQRQRAVIAALLPYSGDNIRPARRGSEGQTGLIPLPRKPSAGEQRVARAASIPKPDPRAAYLRSYQNPYGRPS